MSEKPVAYIGRSRARAFGIAAGVLVLAACSTTPRLAEGPKSGADLSGVWSSDVSRSDDVRTRLRQALESVRPKSRAVPDVPDDSVVEPPGFRRRPDRLPVPPWLLEEERTKREDLIAALVPASKLQIKQTDHGIVLAPLTGGAVRDLTPAERSTLFTSFATLRIVCGWEGNSFYVESYDNESGLRTIERYTLIEGGKALEESLQVKVNHLKEQKYRVIYTRSGE